MAHPHDVIDPGLQGRRHGEVVHRRGDDKVAGVLQGLDQARRLGQRAAAERCGRRVQRRAQGGGVVRVDVEQGVGVDVHHGRRPSWRRAGDPVDDALRQAIAFGGAAARAANDA
ncbi:hypothetical protein D9M68_786630 [compost metagenome]